MKKPVIVLSIIFALAIAASVTMPALAATNVTSDTTIVTGEVADIVIVKAPTDIKLGSMDPGENDSGTSSTKGSVECNSNWSVAISDLKDTSNDGHMTSVNKSSALKTEMNLSIDGGLTWHGAGAGTTVNGNPTILKTEIPFKAQQFVTWDDTPANDYTINITFAITVLP